MTETHKCVFAVDREAKLWSFDCLDKQAEFFVKKKGTLLKSRCNIAFCRYKFTRIPFFHVFTSMDPIVLKAFKSVAAHKKAVDVSVLH